MKNVLVARSDIIKILKSWSDNQITTRDLWNWANERYFPGDTEFDDWEGDNSVSNEVLCTLDCLDMNLVLREDAPIHIKFLNTQNGSFEEGFKRWRRKIDQIDYKQRCKSLRGHEIYGPLCK